jgi:hypothetical protein
MQYDAMRCDAMRCRCRCRCNQCKESVVNWLALGALGVLFVKRRWSGPREMMARRSRDEVLCVTNSSPGRRRKWGLVGGLDVRHGRRSETSGYHM